VKSLLDGTVADEVKIRLGKLDPQTERVWGKMTAAQMLAHCAVGMEWAVGDSMPEKVPLPFRLIGRLIKPKMLRSDAPMKKNSPTARSLVVADERDFRTEQARLSGLVERFATGGSAGCTTNPHSFFGKMTPEEWGVLTYKHLDHHLRQFGV
jgi:hypothetical protein